LKTQFSYKNTENLTILFLIKRIEEVKYNIVLYNPLKTIQSSILSFYCATLILSF